MVKSSRRDKAEGRLERLGARLLEFVGRFTGRRGAIRRQRARRLGRADPRRLSRGRAKQRARR
jgi:hypothetical protein